MANRAARRAAAKYGRVTPTLDERAAARAIEMLEGEMRDEGDDPVLGALAYFHEREQTMQDEFMTLVNRARHEGHTWREIAAVLGVQPASVKQRYRRTIRKVETSYGQTQAPAPVQGAHDD